MIEFPEPLEEDFWSEEIRQKEKRALEYLKKQWKNKKCEFCGSDELKVERGWMFGELAYTLRCKRCGQSSITIIMKEV